MAAVQQAVRTDSLHEEAHLDLIRLYAANGQPAASLRQYQTLERLLREELDAAAVTAGAQVSALALPPERPAGRLLQGDASAQAQALLQALKDEAKVF